MKGADMRKFGTFYLDKEKDIIVSLEESEGRMFYTLRTPNHATGNLLTNLAGLCRLPLSYEANGFKIIQGEIPAYIDGEDRPLWIMRLADTKVANIYPDGTIERKAYVPAIAKTFMSQTKDYRLDASKTLVKTYILADCKFHSDLHTHMNANLSPDVLIALGIAHEICYPLYYIKKLELRITPDQKRKLEAARKETVKAYAGSDLKGKYLERRIDDHTFLNFADLILGNLPDASYNIPKIRASLAVMKDGQAVFTNLEKVYLYRYVFTKASECKERIALKNIEKIPDRDIVRQVRQILADRKNPAYASNTIYQDELLWIARTYAKTGVVYAEISDTSLVKKNQAVHVLKEIHEVMPAVTKETGVTLRFLAAMRRIPLTIVKDHIAKGNYFTDNLQALEAVSTDPYVAGCDFVGEEMNDIRDLKPVIQAAARIAAKVTSFVIRIHAGENDSLPDNVANSIRCVEESLAPGQPFPHMRIGHGLYTADLSSKKGKKLIQEILAHHVVLEFQITSNVRLNNLSSLSHHPLKQYLKAGIACVQGTDGGALYGTDSIDEQLSLERMLELNHEEEKAMHDAEARIIETSLQEFAGKQKQFSKARGESSVEDYLNARMHACEGDFADAFPSARKLISKEVLKSEIQQLPADRIPVVIAGGSFSRAGSAERINPKLAGILDDLLEKGNPKKMFFVIGSSLKGYEKYLLEKNAGRYEVFAIVPDVLDAGQAEKLKEAGVSIRVSIESSPLGIYKSFAYEIFKRRQSVIVAFDGSSAACNLIQDAKNSRYKSRTFINQRSRRLAQKAESLEGYFTFFNEGDDADEILGYVSKYYRSLKDPNAQILKHAGH
jgi:adenosine deaminase